VGTPAVTRVRTVPRAARLWLASATGVAVVAALTTVVARDAAHRSVSFSFPSRASFADLEVVLLHNGVLVGAILIAARWPSRTLDVALGIAWLANVVLAGVALGAYGWRLVAHAGVYAAIELAAWCVSIAVYIEARAHGSWPGLRESGMTVVLIGAAAILETVLPVRL
jgi:hypothetical protein